MTTNDNNPQHIDEIAELDAILQTLTVDQLRYLVARNEFSSIKDAANAIGVPYGTVTHWPDSVERAARLMALDGVHVAREMRRRALPKAMAVKVAGLESKDEKIRQGVSTEIVEWEMGKAVSKTETKLEGSLLLKFDLPKSV